jgi:hypothetical protein
MKTKCIIILAALTLAGCASYQGGTGPGSESTYGSENNPPPEDFNRGGNRASPPPYDTQSGALLRGADPLEQTVPTPEPQ